MKKITYGLIAAAGILSASMTFALDQKSGYYSTQHPQTVVNKTLKAMFPATDITVINATSNVIYVSVPGTSINDILYPNSQPDHIRNDRGAFITPIVLQDAYRTNFFSQSVCPRAVVTVFGNIGSYKVNVDEEYCH